MQQINICFHSLQEAEQQLQQQPPDTYVVLINDPLLARTLGIFAIDYIMRSLTQKHPIIQECIIDCGNDLATQVTASKLGYTTR